MRETEANTVTTSGVSAADAAISGGTRAGSGTDSVGSRSGADSVGSRTGAGSGADSVGSQTQRAKTQENTRIVHKEIHKANTRRNRKQYCSNKVSQNKGVYIW